jgi:hypothetical protein
MIEQNASPYDAASDLRWRAWQARGREEDRRRAIAARVVMIAVAVALAAWLLVELVST